MSGKYLRPVQAAEYVGLSSSTLAKLRVTGQGPGYVKVGAKMILYDIRDLDAWLEAGRRRSTSEN